MTIPEFIARAQGYYGRHTEEQKRTVIGWLKAQNQDAEIYEMRRDGWNCYYELHVSKNANIMRKHIEKIAKADGWSIPLEEWENTRGLVHPIFSYSGPFAYLFLAEDGLGAGIVAHECLHVAMSHERYVLRFGMNYGEDIGEDEERLAYFLTKCIKDVYHVLYEHKHIKQGDKRG